MDNYLEVTPIKPPYEGPVVSFGAVREHEGELVLMHVFISVADAEKVKALVDANPEGAVRIRHLENGNLRFRAAVTRQ